MKIESYRESFGLPDPPEGTMVTMKRLGTTWDICWPDCPDKEDILAINIVRKQDAIDYINAKKWVL